MPKARFRVASVLVGCSKYDFGERGDDGEDSRLGLMAAAADKAIQQTCHVLVLPAGFLVANSSAEQRALERRVLTKLKDKDLLVAFGIDVLSNGNRTANASTKTTTAASYNPHGYVVERGQYLIPRTAQTGVRPSLSPRRPSSPPAPASPCHFHV